MNFNDDQRLMNVHEIAEYLNISRRTVFRLIKNKEIPCLKISNQWRFIKHVIDEWLESKIEEAKHIH